MRITASEVQARREALGLSQSALAHYLGVSQVTVSRWEAGTSRPPEGLDAELSALEDRIEDLVARMVQTVLDVNEDAPEHERVGFLITHTRDATFWERHPEHEGLPATLHRVAAARARVELADEGHELRIMADSDLPVK